jgi:hypothetical protein
MYAQSQKAEKTINLKLWKNSLKSDGQQFHSYQQNEYSCHLNSLNTKIPYFVGNPGTILGQAYKYGGAKSINGIPTLLSSVLNVRGQKIVILHVELLCFVISSVFYKGGERGVKYSRAVKTHSLWCWWGPCCYF